MLKYLNFAIIVVLFWGCKEKEYSSLSQKLTQQIRESSFLEIEKLTNGNITGKGTEIREFTDSIFSAYPNTSDKCTLIKDYILKLGEKINYQVIIDDTLDNLISADIHPNLIYEMELLFLEKYKLQLLRDKYLFDECEIMMTPMQFNPKLGEKCELYVSLSPSIKMKPPVSIIANELNYDTLVFKDNKAHFIVTPPKRGMYNYTGVVNFYSLGKLHTKEFGWCFKVD